MARLVKQNIDNFTLEGMTENSTIANTLNPDRAIVQGVSTDYSIPGLFILERLTRQVEIDGVMKPEQYYAQAWKIEDINSNDSAATVPTLMQMLLDGDLEEPVPNELTIPEGAALLEIT